MFVVDVGVSVSCFSRWVISCSIVITGMFSFWPSFSSWGRRIISPFSATISAITATAGSFARRISSTPASVWPPRARTPPSTARRGSMWPGRRTSPGFAFGAARVRTVFVRSLALMPVVMPWVASTVTV